VNPQVADTRRHKRAALTAMIGASLVLGILDTALGLPLGESPGRLAFTVAGNLALLLIGFRWLQVDALELDIRRPAWLNVGIVLLAVAFVPYYLYKTRPPRHRLPAIGGFFGLVLACMLGSAAGALLMNAMSGGPATP
jgi:outer membrane lipoprotein SlyB